MCSREDIAKRIAETLLDDGALDEHNFSGTDAVLDFVESVILAKLKDFVIIKGNVL